MCKIFIIRIFSSVQLKNKTHKLRLFNMYNSSFLVLIRRLNIKYVTEFCSYLFVNFLGSFCIDKVCKIKHQLKDTEIPLSK